jgi:hypothetical protein
MLPSACSFFVEVSCHCFTLHVSAYMAIFKCVGCYYSHVLEGTCFDGFFCILHVVTLCTWLCFCRFSYVFSCSIFPFYFAVPCVRVYLLVFLCCLFGAAETCSVKQWQLTSTIKLHADGNITYKTHWTVQCSRMLKYSNMVLTLRVKYWIQFCKNLIAIVLYSNYCSQFTTLLLSWYNYRLLPRIRYSFQIKLMSIGFKPYYFVYCLNNFF